MRSRARALESHRHGDRDATRTMLDASMAEDGSGPWSTYVRLDAAWLALEDHDVERAQDLLSETYSWPDEHPRGMAVKARLLFEERRFDEARGLLQSAMALRPRCAEDAAGQLDIYRRAAAGEAVEMPPVRRLPSVW